jgi:hypothetical protein
MLSLNVLLILPLLLLEAYFHRLCNSYSLYHDPQSTHRVATAAFWRTSHHDGGCRVQAHPLSLYLPSSTKLQCTLQLRGQLHTTPISSLPLCTLWFHHCLLLSLHCVSSRVLLNYLVDGYILKNLPFTMKAD